MDTGKSYVKLYAYFHEVCLNFIYTSVHQKHSIPETGDGMYRYLSEHLPRIHGKRTYDETIQDAPFLSQEQKGLLTPENGVINLARVDVALYIQINCLLDEERRGHRWKFLIDARNTVSHLAMQKLYGMESAETFDSDLYLLNRSFKKFGFERRELKGSEAFLN